MYWDQVGCKESEQELNPLHKEAAANESFDSSTGYHNHVFQGDVGDV